MKRLGYVIWFDDSSGDGMIRDAKTGDSIYIHWSAIKYAQKSFVRDWKTLEKLTPVEFVVYYNLYSRQVLAAWKIEHNGTVENEWKLNRLMNYLFEIGDPGCIDISTLFYKGIA